MLVRNLTMSTSCIFYVIHVTEVVIILFLVRYIFALLTIHSYHVNSTYTTSQIIAKTSGVPISTQNSSLSKLSVLKYGSNTTRQLLTKEIYVPGFERSHPELCRNLGDQLRLVILVASAPSNFTARKAIRMTWGHCRLRTDITLAFLLGKIPSDLRQVIDVEDQLYGDIIVGRFVDTYYNMTLKTLSMLEWMVNFCPNAYFLLKTDDDMFFNVPKLMKFLKEKLHSKRTIFGNIKRNMKPCRVAYSRFYVPENEFSGGTWPEFTNGAGYVVTRDLFGPLLNAAILQPYIRFEDVFFTGVVANKLGAHRLRISEPYYVDSKVFPCYCAVRYVIAVHGLEYHEYFSYWETLFNGKPCKCIQNIEEEVTLKSTTKMQRKIAKRFDRTTLTSVISRRLMQWGN